MKTLIVQIKCEIGQTYDVAIEIMDDVMPAELYSISGPFDLLGIFRLEEDVDPGYFVNKKLHMVNGIKNTSSTVAFNAFTPSKKL